MLTITPSQPLDQDLTDIATLSISANQVLGKNSGNTTWEGKTVTAGTGISVTHGVGTITIGTAGGASSALSNLVNVPTTISADTSYIVLDYLKVTSDLTVSGNLGVL